MRMRKGITRMMVLAAISCGVLQYCSYAQPTTIAINILTPGSEIYAGNEFKAEVRVYDVNGLISGEYCTKMAYQDTLGAASGQIKGKMTIDGVDYEINKWPDTTNRIDQCFQNGIDTVSIVLYNAGTEFHKIWAKAGSINGVTNEFVLYPGSPNRMKITNTVTNTDTNEITIFYPAGSVQLTAGRYDAWNNLIDRVNCTWTQTGSLHAIDLPFGSQISYGTTGVTSEETGMIIATTAGSAVMRDTVNVNVRMPSAVIETPPKYRLEIIESGKEAVFDMLGRGYKGVGVKGRNSMSGILILTNARGQAMKKATTGN